MNFIKRLFGFDKPEIGVQEAPQLTQREQDIQAAANELWEMLKEIMEIYYADGCAATRDFTSMYKLIARTLENHFI